MDWTAILRNAGIPEPVGRDEAIAAARAATAARYKLTGGPVRARGHNTSKPASVPRKQLQERERAARG